MSGGDVITSFSLLRLINDESVEVTISIVDEQEDPSEGTSRFAWKIQRNLIPYIINSMVLDTTSMEVDEYLERYDEFTIILILNSDQDNELYIEEWDYIHQPIEV